MLSYLYWAHSQKTIKTTNALADLVYDYVLTNDITKDGQPPSQPPSGFKHIKKKIAHAVTQQQPLQFALVGFPYKSQNTLTKVVSPHADGAETYSLHYLNNLLTSVKKIYAPGAQMTIFTDGLVFADIEGVADSTVLTYETALKAITSSMPNITIKGLIDLIPGSTPTQARALLASYTPNSVTFKHHYATDHKIQESVAHLASWLALEFDHPACPQQLKQKTINDIAQQLTHRGLQYSTFLQPFRPASVIRLSVTYQSDLSQKMGCKLSPSSSITPWHGVLVRDDQSNFFLKHRAAMSKHDTYQSSYTDHRR